MRKQLSREELVKRLRKIAMNKEDFLKGVKKSSLYKKFYNSNEGELIDESNLKRSRDWNILLSQIILS